MRRTFYPTCKIKVLKISVKNKNKKNKNKNKFISENMTMIIKYGMKITVSITPGNPYYGDYR